LILKAFGLDASSVRVESDGFVQAATRLLTGDLDGMFDNAINQADSVRRATAGGARLVPIEGAPVERLRREYPFLRPTSIPRGLYPGTTTAVHTLGVDGLLVCRQDLDETLVYTLTREFFNVLPTLSLGAAARLMDLDAAPATPIPLHNGAARYYRERELVR
jgi:TRAP transporter TAXI family solute receptor